NFGSQKFTQLFKSLTSIKIIRIDYGKRFINGFLGTKNRMSGAKRFFSLRVKKILGQFGAQCLNYKIHLYFPLKLWNKYIFYHFQNFFPNDKNHFSKTCTNGIKNRILHNGFLIGTKAFYLLIAPITAADSCCQNQ